MATQLTDNVLDEILSDAVSPEVSIPNDSALKVISRLAQQQIDLEAKVEAKELELKVLNDELNDIRLVQLPKAMLDAQMSSFTLTSGEEVLIEQKHYASITDKNRHAALLWLKANGHGSLIKTFIEAQFPKGTEELQRKAVEFLKELGVSFSCDESVHASTLKSFVTEQMNAKVDLPKATLGIFSQDTAKIKRPRANKAKRK